MSKPDLSRRLRIAPILLLIACVYWPAGFYPFNPVPVYPNHAAFNDEGALSFDGRGIAFTPAAPPWLEAAIEAGRMELTFELRPARIDQKGATIFTIGNDSEKRNFTLRQHERTLVIQYVRDNQERPIKSLYVGKVFKRADWYTIRVVLEKDAMTVNVDGEPTWSRELSEDTFTAWSSDYRVALGNAPEFGRPWQGQIRKALVTAGQQQLDYASPQHVETPATYQRTYERSLDKFLMPTPLSLAPALIRDWVINLLGFIPLGLLTALLWRDKRPVTAAFFVCVLTTLSIEVTQVFLPWRVPALHDVILNVAGGLMGAWLAVFAMRARRHRQARSARLKHAEGATLDNA